MPINSNENRKMIYSENTSLIISELMKKYKLEETEKEFLEILEKGEKTNGEKTAEIIIDVVKNEILLKNLPFYLQQNLGISKITAKRLANDIKENFFSPREKVSKKKSLPSEKLSISSSEIKPRINFKEKEKITIPKKDIYRESLT